MRRVADNFAFAERHADDVRYRTIVEARDRLGLGWDEAVAYADGYYAARAGWAECPHGNPSQVRSYRLGFSDGGGRPDDLFDVARRAFEAAAPEDHATGDRTFAIASSLPSSWLPPSDAPRPVPWSARLLLVGIGTDPPLATRLLDEVRRYAGHEEACILTVDAVRGFASWCCPAGNEQSLADWIARREFSDVLVSASGADLARIDVEASSLPLCRTVARTGRSALQQRAHLRIWLQRGLCPGETRAAGHIRWGKLASGLTGRLGEFTARYIGPVRPRGHNIRMELADGSVAHGYATAWGQPLAPEQVISNRSHLRREMTIMLRAFAAAMPQPFG